MILINACNTMLNAFFSLFFGVYILQNINNDLIFVLYVNLFATAVGFLFSCVFYYVFNQRTIMFIYRLSFAVILSLMLMMLFLPVGLYLPFLVLSLFKCSNYLYYTPHEIAIMDKNKAKEISGFLAKSAIVSGLTAIAAPFLIGVIVSEINFLAMFITLGAFSIVMLICSFFIPNITIAKSPQKYMPLKFMKISLKYKHMRSAYLSHFFTKTSKAGAISLLLPIMIFMHTDSEFELGMYASLIALVALLFLMIYAKFKKWQAIIVVITSLLWVGSAFSLLIHVALVSFIIYSITARISEKVYSNAHTTAMNNSIKIPELEPYKREFHFTYNVLKKTSDLMTLGITLILCLHFDLEIVIPIIFAVFTSTNLISVFFNLRCKKQLEKFHERDIIES